MIFTRFVTLLLDKLLDKRHSSIIYTFCNNNVMQRSCYICAINFNVRRLAVIPVSFLLNIFV